jgi:hypothetical protein
MMRTKSAYREKPAENIPPTVEAAIAPSPEAPAVAVDVRPEPEPQPQSEAAREHEQQISQADEAADALRKQIEALRQSEQLQRQAATHAARLQQQPLTREGKLDLWRQQGMPADQLAFLEANPALVDYSELAAFAANEAAQAGHERGSHEHMQATKQIFDKHLAHLQAQAQRQTEPAMTEPPSKFFAPPPAKPVRAPSVPYSAPVSREIPNGGPRPQFEENPSRVILSADEKAIARASNITEVEYARQKVRMMQAKARGEIV